MSAPLNNNPMFEAIEAERVAQKAKADLADRLTEALFQCSTPRNGMFTPREFCILCKKIITKTLSEHHEKQSHTDT